MLRSLRSLHSQLRNFTRSLSGPAASQEGLPAHRVAPRKSRRGGSELTPILSADEAQTPVDLLETAPPEDLLNEEPSETAASSDRGPLAQRMWTCARRGVRCEDVWARFAQRVLMTGTFRGAKDVSLMFRAFAKIKYRDVKALDTLSPFILRHIDSFSTHELALLLSAHKRLEYERTDNIHLLVGMICQRKDDWTGPIVALTCNAVAHFYIYRPHFWRKASMSLMRLVWSMSPLELFLVISAMARVDRRDEPALRMLAKMCHRCAQRNLFNQETLATTLNAFAKLDYNHAKLSQSLEQAVLVKLNRALELGPQYRTSRYLQELDVFDVQALVLLFRSLIVLVGTTDEVAEKLLTLLQWSKDEMSDYQKRVLKPCSFAFRQLHPLALKKLSRENRDALHIFENAKVEVKTFESRWMAEVRRTLRKMDIKVELKPLVDDQVLDIWMPVSKAVVCPIGPYGYYAGTTHRTAYSKMHQRILELEGHVCIPVPYFEWAELKTDEDKMVYLWSLGRKAAGGRDRQMDVPSETEPAEVEDWQSDLTDTAAAEL